MSDKMTPIPYRNLLNKLYKEYQSSNSIFGIHRSHFFKFNGEKNYEFFGQKCDSPVGPAAGPHTQMTQNIISAFLCGARFFELKTVQILDDLEIAKPCILIKNEGYNTEWSQELSLRDSYDEYLKAWFSLHLLNRLIFNKEIPGNFIFNMSVGYDLKGIKSEPVNSFIENMIETDENKFKEYLIDTKDFIKSIELKNFDLPANEEERILNDLDSIPKKISNSVTISTMHGCPPNEIEKIAEYLIKQKRLHTYIKLNPTLLGFKEVKRILSNNGYKKIEIKEESFLHDLQFNDAVNLIEKLEKIAVNEKLKFGLKLSNTLPVKVQPNSLPGDEMYLSGKILFPITISVADKITDHLGSNISISFSGGADATNIKQILNCGITPVTLATDLLKPGGYYRLNQICDAALQSEIPPNVEKLKLRKLAVESGKTENYGFNEDLEKGVTINKKLEMFDCFKAPCVVSCPIGQDIPTYLNYCDKSDYDSAAKVILNNNPLPHITAYICDHQCQFNCTRIEYDFPVKIRDFKKLAIENTRNIQPARIENKKNIKVAVVGAGPAGLSIAHYLSRKGITVEIFEKENNAGGIVRNFIPQFRIPTSIIQEDIDFLINLGVKFHFNSRIDSISKIYGQDFKYIFIGIGAEISNEVKLEESDKPQLHALDILWQIKNEPEKIKISGKVAVIGGGNSAMDCARAVKRLSSVEEVAIIYRRTEELMPADKEEFKGALEDGVKFIPLLQPVSFRNRILKCRKTTVGNKIENSRPEIIFTDNYQELEFDHLISAIGEYADKDFFKSINILMDEFGNPVVNSETNESSLENIFIGGDCLRGPKTVVQAAADAQKATKEILLRENIPFGNITPESEKRINFLNLDSLIMERGKIFPRSSNSKDSLCLNCDLYCNKCVEVCPNRANISLQVKFDKFKDINQIIHIDSLCNECGNCSQFCPYEGDPYKEKYTIFNSEKELLESKNEGIIWLGDKFKLKYQNEFYEFDYETVNNLEIPEKMKELTKVVIRDESLF